ncbi:methyltransferase, FxLD system [Nocardiopsis alba]|uniref:methyltransferase, FxLD system n=1 Tax=Nocardiopsis alba TaxID=53437 RepID=UPI0033EE2655
MTETSTLTEDTIAHARHTLADRLCAEGTITDAAVEEAFRNVPRHAFLPHASLEEAYSDTIVSIKDDESGRSLSCASMPGVVASMLEQARIEPGARVLEVGAGTGYNAALLGRIVGEHGRVVTIDVDRDLTDDAAARLAETGATDVEVVLGDGALGYEAGAPYDRVIATVGSHRIPAAWLRQLAPEGRLIAPVRVAGDVSYSIVFERDGEKWASVDARPATFIPLRDSVEEDTRAYRSITGDDRVTLQVNREQRVTDEQVRGVLDEPSSLVWTGVTIGGMEPRDKVWLRLALLLDNSVSRMLVERAAIVSGLVAPGLPWGDMASVPVDERGLAYLTARALTADPRGEWEFGVVGHGEAGRRLAERMADLIRGWERTAKVGFEVRLDGEGRTSLDVTWD